jgi:predicted DNA-binding ribbon-helix-helix protein
MWSAIKDISRRERCTVHELCSLIQLRKLDITSLTAAIRVFIMLYYRAASTEEGHTRAGHGCFNTMKRRAKILEEVEGVKAKMPNADIGMSDNDQDEFYDEAV